MAINFICIDLRAKSVKVQNWRKRITAMALKFKPTELPSQALFLKFKGYIKL